MFKFRSISQLTRRAGIALLLAVSLGATLLPTAALAAPLAGQHGRRGPGCPDYYVVKAGDTLSGIAVSYRVSLWALRDVNHIGNINRIYTGEYICIPAGRHPGGPQNHHPSRHH